MRRVTLFLTLDAATGRELNERIQQMFDGRLRPGQPRTRSPRLVDRGLARVARSLGSLRGPVDTRSRRQDVSLILDEAAGRLEKARAKAWRHLPERASPLHVLRRWTLTPAIVITSCDLGWWADFADAGRECITAVYVRPDLLTVREAIAPMWPSGTAKADAWDRVLALDHRLSGYSQLVADDVHSCGSSLWTGLAQALGLAWPADRPLPPSVAHPADYAEALAALLPPLDPAGSASDQPSFLNDPLVLDEIRRRCPTLTLVLAADFAAGLSVAKACRGLGCGHVVLARADASPGDNWVDDGAPGEADQDQGEHTFAVSVVREDFISHARELSAQGVAVDLVVLCDESQRQPWFDAAQADATKAALDGASLILNAVGADEVGSYFRDYSYRWDALITVSDLAHVSSPRAAK